MKIFFPEALFPTKKNVKKLIEKMCGGNSAVFTENKDIMEHYTYLLKGFNNMAMGYHKVRTFSEEEVDNIYLTEDELKAMADLELSGTRLDKYRDIFLIGCKSGDL